MNHCKIIIIGLLLTTSFSTLYANTFESANELYQRYKDLDLQSRNIILEANKVRQKIHKLRAKARLSKNEDEKKSSMSSASLLAKELDIQQKNGASIRLESREYRKKALIAFEEAFATKWKKWLTQRAPLTMDQSVIDTIAHNAQLKSVHPTMLNKMGTASEKLSEQQKEDKSMTLKIPALASQNAPPDLDIGSVQISHNDHFLGHIEIHNANNNSNDSNVSSVPLNQMHQWRFLLIDRLGNPVRHAKIDVAGHMPGHVHGIPTQPMVTEEIEDGVYLVDGLKFQMQGWWVIQFHIDSTKSVKEKSSAIKDTLSFNLVL